MMKARSVWGAGIAAMSFCTMAIQPSSVGSQTYSLPAELQAKVDSHPQVRKLTDWGGRPDWSADSKRLLFVSREYGDVFELDIATGRTRPITFHFSHDGIFRAYYLPNGDILLTAPKDHTPGRDFHGRFFESELWLLKSDLSGPPMPFNERNVEGAAVARNSMKIAWATPIGSPPSKSETDRMMADPDIVKAETNREGRANQIWMGDVIVKDGARLANKRMLLDCGAASGPLAQLLSREGRRCVMIEPQNFVPRNEDRLTFSILSTKLDKPGPIEIGAYVLDLKTNTVSNLSTSPGYAEAEGVFPDGKSMLIEHSSETALDKATKVLDLWRMALDGSGKLERVTRYNSIDPELKSNQGVVSPDGRWLAFSVSTRTIEAKVPGQGIGLFLMDLPAAGIR